MKLESKHELSPSFCAPPLLCIRLIAAPDISHRAENPQYATLTHGDSGHLNVDGTRRLEQLFRRYFFGQVIC